MVEQDNSIPIDEVGLNKLMLRLGFTWRDEDEGEGIDAMWMPPKRDVSQLEAIEAVNGMASPNPDTTTAPIESAPVGPHKDDSKLDEIFWHFKGMCSAHDDHKCCYGDHRQLKTEVEALIAKAVQEAKNQDYSNLSQLLYRKGLDVTAAVKILAEFKSLQARKEKT